MKLPLLAEGEHARVRPSPEVRPSSREHLHPEGKVVIETWRRNYNDHRPHLSLGYLAPSEFINRLSAAAI